MTEVEGLGLDDDVLRTQIVRSCYGVISVSQIAKIGRPEPLTLRLGLSLMHAVSLGGPSDLLRAHGSELNSLLSQTSGRAILTLAIHYVLATDDRDRVVQALKATSPKLQQTTMTFAEELLKEGREEGLAEGREAAERTMVRNMLSNGLSPEEVARLTGLPLATVRKIAKLEKNG